MGAIIGYASFDLIDLAGIKNLLDKPDTTSWPSHLMIAEPWGLYLSRINYPKTGKCRLNSSYLVFGFDSLILTR